MASKHLHLEERIYLARRALNEKTLSFQNQLPKEEQLNFHQFVLDVMSILDGDQFSDARIRLELVEPGECLSCGKVEE